MPIKCDLTINCDNDDVLYMITVMNVPEICSADSCCWKPRLMCIVSDFSEEGKSSPIFFFDGSIEASNYIRKPPERILKKSLTVFLKIK